MLSPRRMRAAQLFARCALCLGVSCSSSASEPEVATTEVAGDMAEVPQELPAADLGFLEPAIEPAPTPPDPGAALLRPLETQNPNGANGELPERGEPEADDFSTVGDESLTPPPSELVVDSVADPDNTGP